MPKRLVNSRSNATRMARNTLGQIVELTGVSGVVVAIKIQVEDAASAILQYPNGAHGSIQVGTVEAPGATRFEIAGTKATLLLERGKLRMAVLEQPSDKFIRTTNEAWGRIQSEWVDIEAKDNISSHLGGVQAMIEDFVVSLRKKRKSLCPAEEGRMSVELANAMIMSSVLGKTVDLPIDSKRYDRLLKRLIKQKGLR